MNAPSITEVVLAAHLPLLQVDAESTPFAGGDLWRMPFETFDALTARAYSDHRATYEDIAPVFYRLVVHQPLPAIPDEQAGAPMLQLKVACNDWSVVRAAGLGVFERFHLAAVEPAWLALLLQAPDAALPPPRWTMGFAVADPGFGFPASSGAVARIASVQGDADVDYLITPGFEPTPLDRAALEAASHWCERLSDAASIDPALWPALDALGACASPLLGRSDRGVLATLALESLLLPDVRGGMARTLARRVASLLGGDAKERRRRESGVRSLYEARSATLHGTAPDDLAETLATADTGPPLLASALRALDAAAAGRGLAVSAVVEALDAGAPPRPTAAAPPAEAARVWRPPLQRQRFSMVATLGTVLESEPGSWLLWAPLAGVHCRAPLTLDGTRMRLVIPLTGAEVLTLEERDIRRDFAAQLNVVGEHLAALSLRLDEREAGDAEAAFARLERARDLAVASLRLCGLHAFCDPALAGPVLMNRAIRLRRPTVLRQSVWQLMNDDSGAVELTRAADEARIAGHQRRLLAYDAQGGHADIERSLSLYLRGFDRRFSSPHSCAMLHFAAIESLLGRFGGAGEAARLERLVSALRGPDDACAIWFAAHGRRLRNDVAHGRTADPIDVATLDILATVSGAALARAIELWLTAPGSAEAPAARLIGELAGALD